jgi:hypothetical protein
MKTQNATNIQQFIENTLIFLIFLLIPKSKHRLYNY